MREQIASNKHDVAQRSPLFQPGKSQTDYPGGTIDSENTNRDFLVIFDIFQIYQRMTPKKNRKDRKTQ